MNQEQNKAAEKLKRALNKCAKAGLRGGVYEGSFCLWPEESECPHEINERGGACFFEAIEDQCQGTILNGVKMHLDGGSGW